MHTPGRRRPHPALSIVALVLLLALGAACRDDAGSDVGPGPTIVRPDREGDPRKTLLGFSALPSERTTSGYVAAFADAAINADILLIHRAPEWSDFFPGGSVSAATAETTRFDTELLGQYENLQLFFAIDPTDSASGRARIADAPVGVDPEAGFSDPALRNAFLAYTAYVVANYEPDYLAIGVEINMLYERNPAQFEAFVSLYEEAYDAAKQARPEMRIFPTLQYEDLLGLADEIHAPHWEVIDAFDGRIDVLALSSYPSRSFTTAGDIPADYYTQASAHFDGEIMLAETGYTSAPADGFLAIGTEEDQRAFVQRLQAESDAGSFSAVVWYAAEDPGFAPEGPAARLNSIGLRTNAGEPKLAWETWEAWSRRPVE